MIEKNSLSSQIEKELRDEIISGRIAPGERLSINQLAARWGTSSTPVRDAFGVLEGKGFVKKLPRRYIHVLKLDAKSFKDLNDIRIALECMAVELACPVIPPHEIDEALEKFHTAYELSQSTGDRNHLADIDTLVHDLVIRYCGNSRLIDNIDGMQDLIEWGRSYVACRPGSYENAYPEHVAILEALKLQDSIQAVEAMKSHLRNAYDRALPFGE
jgi:DNA-binding GntR family transcriptional regulator